MSNFWGCDTQAMAALGERFTDAAGRADMLGAHLAQSSLTVSWEGPDAQEHRERTLRELAVLTDLMEEVRRLAERLRGEAEQQDEASEADSRSGTSTQVPARSGAPMPWHLPPGLPRLSREDGFPSPLPPWPVGPGLYDPEGVTRWKERLRGIELPDLKYVRLMMADPTRQSDERPWPLQAAPRSRDGLMLPDPPSDPTGSDLAPSAEQQDAAERSRASMLSTLPVVGPVQTVMGMHTALGAGLEGTRDSLVAEDAHAAAALMTPFRVSHALSGAVLGEHSMLGQVGSVIDAKFASALQTQADLTSAVENRDLGAGARAVEQAMFRDAGSTGDLLMSSPLSTVGHTTAELTAIASDATRPVAPEVSEALGDVSDHVSEQVDRFEQWTDASAHAQRLYDLRREAVPLPWDEPR